MSLPGLAGFARLCAGDQYEVSQIYIFVRLELEQTYFHNW